MTYRAAILQAPDKQSSQPLTLPEHAHLSDEDLRAEALAEAKRADLVGDEWPRAPLEEIEANLVIGEWHDAR